MSHPSYGLQLILTTHLLSKLDIIHAIQIWTEKWLAPIRHDVKHDKYEEELFNSVLRYNMKPEEIRIWRSQNKLNLKRLTSVENLHLFAVLIRCKLSSQQEVMQCQTVGFSTV